MNSSNLQRVVQFVEGLTELSAETDINVSSYSEVLLKLEDGSVPFKISYDGDQYEVEINE